MLAGRHTSGFTNRSGDYRKLPIVIFIFTYLALLASNNLKFHVDAHHAGDGHEHGLMCLFESQVEAHLPLSHELPNGGVDATAKLLHLAGSIFLFAFVAFVVAILSVTKPLSNLITYQWPTLRKRTFAISARGPPIFV